MGDIGDQKQVCDCYRLILGLRLPVVAGSKEREIVTEFFPINGKKITDSDAIEKVIIRRGEHAEAGAVIGIEELDFGRLTRRGAMFIFQHKRFVILPPPKKEGTNERK